MWTLRRKILLGYAAVMALAALVLAVALWNIVRLGNAGDEILQENYRSILAAEEMLNALALQENAAMQLVIGLERENVARFSQAERQFLLWLERAKANVTIEGEPAILLRIERGYSDFLFRLAQFRNIHQGNRQRGIQFYEERLAPQAAAVREACQDLHDLNRRTMEASSRRARTVARTAVWSMIGVGIVVLAGAIFASISLSNRIVRPVQSLTEATERVAAGDYNVTIMPESRDEVGQLAQKFNLMLAKLRAYHELNLRRITGEQKKAETILRTIDDGVLVIGADRKVVSVNPTAMRILGLPKHGAEGCNFAEILDDEDLVRATAEAFNSGSAAKGEPTSSIITVGDAEGSPRHYEYTLTPITAPDEDLIGLVVLFRDVTALKELDRLKTEFVMTASHELRTPLTSIAMSIELLREQAPDTLDDSSRQMLDVAHEELGRLRALVDELLDLSKIESGKLEIEFADVSIPTILQAAVAPFRAQAEEQSVRLELSVPEGLPIIRADPNKLAWVVTNLVGNALRYARSEVEVSAERAGPWIYFYVRDDGQGIPHELQARIFDKFVHVPGDKNPGGAGLGLAISKEIMKAHRGRIWVESEPGQGTLFIATLPIPRTVPSGTTQ